MVCCSVNVEGGEIDVSRYSLDQVQTLRLTIGDNDDIFISARQASVAALLAIETMSEIPIDKQPHLSTQLQVGSFGYVSPYLRYVRADKARHIRRTPPN